MSEIGVVRDKRESARAVGAHGNANKRTSIMKQYVFLTALLGVVCLRPTLSLAVDYTGQWRGTITESVNECKNLAKGEPGEYMLTFVHNGADFVGMENKVKRPYKGVVNPSRPQFVHLVGSYVTNGGYVTETIDIEFLAETAGTAKSVWRWSNDFFSCGGSFAFTLKKVQP